MEDDGPGYLPDTAADAQHIGLQNVRERLEIMCGGSLEIAERSGGGTVVTACVPRTESAEA